MPARQPRGAKPTALFITHLLDPDSDRDSRLLLARRPCSGHGGDEGRPHLGCRRLSITPVGSRLPASACPPVRRRIGGADGRPTTIRRLYGRARGTSCAPGSRPWSRSCCRRSACRPRGRSPPSSVRRRAPAAFRDRLRRRRASRLARRPACPITASSAPSRSSTAWSPRSAMSATGISPMSGFIWATRSSVLERVPDAGAALRLSAPPRSLAQGAPRQAADGQSRPARPDRAPSSSRAASSGSAPTIRSIAAGR